MINIAVIGAGISGLVVARMLQARAKVTVFEKSKSPSGRLASRRGDGFHFDHGAQFFIVKTPRFHSLVKKMVRNQVVKRWRGRFVEFEGENIVARRTWGGIHPHYVGVPGMSAIGKYLSQGLDISFNTEVAKIQKGDRWDLLDIQGSSLGEFDWVICTAPAPQTASLMPKSFKYHQIVSSTQMLACFSLMLGFKKPLPLDFEAALVRGWDISWISVNSSKPDRPGGFTLLVHATNKWSQLHIDDEPGKVLQYLCDQTSKVIGHDVISLADYKDLRGFRYANMDKRRGKTALVDTEQGLVACGDWCIQGRVEAAFTSGFAAANAILKVIR